MRQKTIWTVASLAIVVPAAVYLASGMATNPKIQWRTRLVSLKLQGLLPHVDTVIDVK